MQSVHGDQMLVTGDKRHTKHLLGQACYGEMNSVCHPACSA